MHWESHSELTGFHAALSPSNYHWLNYDDEKLFDWFNNRMEAARGTALHQFAHDAIVLKQKMPNTNKTLARYVNDALGYKMKPEVLLFYSENCFGTADAIKFDERTKQLRIHDLKNGVTKASMKQLWIYAALFCLEYGYKPSQIKIELRIYQNDEVYIEIPEVDVITHVMDVIVTHDEKIKRMQMERYA